MDHDPDDPRLPDPLFNELSRFYRADPAVPTEVDQAILNRARAHFAGRSWLRLLLRAAGAAAAVPAVIPVVVFIQRPGNNSANPVAPAHAAPTGAATRYAPAAMDLVG